MAMDYLNDIELCIKTRTYKKVGCCHLRGLTLHRLLLHISVTDCTVIVGDTSHDCNVDVCLLQNWLQYQSLWDLQPEHLYSRLGNSLPRWMKILKELK